MIKTITMPLPAKILSPNARPNRHAKTAAIREARSHARRECYKSMKTWGLPFGTYFITSLEVIAYWKTSRHKWDNINLLASCKHYEDGIQDAVGQDDSTWEME